MSQKNRSTIFLYLPAIIATITAVCMAAGIKDNSPAPARIVIKNQGFLPFADAPIHYRSQNLNDPVANLQKRLDRGQVKLQYEPAHGYLRSVLDVLHIPVSSQTLVFSKTSFQFPQITPATPRALYYNDDVYVGQVHGAKFLEFISFDPMQGAIFYILDERQTEHPKFERAETDCLQCHVAASTRNVPGVMLRSVFTKPSGYPAAGTLSFITGHESPWNQRWGGWYVTARQGAPVSMANVTTADGKSPAPQASAAETSLAGHIDTGSYLTGSSDIVALLVLAHQTQMHNLITQTNYQTRLALFAEEARNKAAGLPSGTVSEAARKQWEGPAEQLVRYLLFANEASIPGLITGTSRFTEEFAARGPRDIQGRSLRDFDLHRRIFKYPCSYLIYSDDFNAIPSPAKEFIYHRLLDVLSGREQAPEFASLSPEDRSAILEILLATKSDLPQEWHDFVRQADRNYSPRASVAAVHHQP